jgi:hypothetical protein
MIEWWKIHKQDSTQFWTSWWTQKTSEVSLWSSSELHWMNNLWEDAWRCDLLRYRAYNAACMCWRAEQDVSDRMTSGLCMGRRIEYRLIGWSLIELRQYWDARLSWVITSYDSMRMACLIDCGVGKSIKYAVGVTKAVLNRVVIDSRALSHMIKITRDCTETEYW